ncbi:MAG: acyltransferase family protein [Enterococcus lacertideformus]|uniref:Acyltransferase family protein n=1 Tax=Enterococcus lacertideformus TaxID=2771493 RepID=A0A931AU16_9ENTE|nr:acyltransferase family protein [Enterococcus lacertideformus]
MKEVQYINYAKGIGIALVVLGHIGFLEQYIYAFHMPFFFFLSGFLLSNIEKKKTKRFVNDKVKRLLIPYFSFSIVSFLYWLCIEKNLRSVAIKPTKAFMNILFPSVGDKYVYNVPLWFLIALFITIILVFLAIKYIKNKYILLILSLLLFICIGNNPHPRFFELSIALSGGQFFLLLGFFSREIIGKDLKSLQNKSDKYLVITLFVSLLCIILFAKVNHFEISMMSNHYGNLFYATFSSISGIVFLFSLSLLLNNWSSNLSLLNTLGKDSLFIMGVHEPIKRVVIFLLSKITHIQEDVLRNTCLYALTILVLVLMLSLFLKRLIPKPCKKYFSLYK